MDAAILCIGTELTRGEIHNTNATWLAERLTALGADVVETTVVDDDRGRIARTLERLGAVADLIVSTGGLGPTTDDITTEVVAATLGVGLVRDSASLDAIGQRMAKYGRQMAPSNAKQADFPGGATVLPNAWGTAPGFSIGIAGGARLFVLPGVPREMKPMFDGAVAPVVRAERRGGIAQVRLKTFGLPESTVNDRLAGIEAASDVTIGYRAHFPEIEVKVLARRATDEEAAAAARAAADAVTGRLGSVVYGEGETSFPEYVGRLLAERRLTLATAESCTGGMVASLVTDVPGSSAYFRGGVVSYDNAIKVDVLGVDPATLAREGAVSGAVATEMALGARRLLEADIAVSLTGVAGPGGGTEQKPVGLVHLALATGAGTTSKHIIAGGDRAMVRRRAAFAALAMVAEAAATRG